jgi:hypothetical protein
MLQSILDKMIQHPSFENIIEDKDDWKDFKF